MVATTLVEFVIEERDFWGSIAKVQIEADEIDNTTGFYLETFSYCMRYRVETLRDASSRNRLQITIYDERVAKNKRDKQEALKDPNYIFQRTSVSDFEEALSMHYSVLSFLNRIEY